MLASNLFPLFVNNIHTETNAFGVYLRENIALPPKTLDDGENVLVFFKNCLTMR
jgi:hypothetical protein